MCVDLTKLKHVAPGYGCCKCRVYNDLRREYCRNCGQKHCLTLVEKLPPPSENEKLQ